MYISKYNGSFTLAIVIAQDPDMKTENNNKL